MALKAVFFDLDETLCNTSASRLERATLMVQRLCRQDASLNEESLIQRALEPHPEHGLPTGSGIIEELGLSETQAGREAKGMWFFEGCTHLVGPNDGVLDVLQTLSRSYTLGVITNGADVIQRRKFSALTCEMHFARDLFVSSERAGASKPDSAIYRFALESCGIRPSEAVHVGDMAQVDVLGAQAAGMRGVWYNKHRRPAQGGIVPDAVIHHFNDLPEVLRLMEDG